MKMTFDELKSSYKSHIRQQVPSSQVGCPSPETILHAFEPSTSSADKAKVVNHVAGCSLCLREFELWLSFLREEEKAINDIISWAKTDGKGAIAQSKKAKIQELPFSPRAQIRSVWKWAFGLISAAAITGLFFVGVKSILMNSEDEERGRLPGLIHLVSPVQGQKVRIPFVFRWEQTPRAESYNLEIFDKALLPLWKSPRVEALQYELPPQARQLIKKGESYFWTITAWLEDGMKRESPLEDFTIDK